MDISARFADQAEKESLEVSGFRSIPSELGKVMVPEKGVILGDTIALGLLKLLWMQKITVRGVRPEGV